MNSESETHRVDLPLLIDVLNAARSVGDGGERCDRAFAGRRLRFEAGADGEIGVEAEGTKDLPVACVHG